VRIELWPTGRWNGSIEIETRAGDNRISWCVDVTHIGATMIAEGGCEGDFESADSDAR
jgi:hypothetical protein